MWISNKANDFDIPCFIGFYIELPVVWDVGAGWSTLMWLEVYGCVIRTIGIMITPSIRYGQAVQNCPRKSRKILEYVLYSVDIKFKFY